MVTSVTGQHQYGKSHADVVCVYSENKNLNCFLKNLEKFFENLDTINFSGENISKLTRSDLQPFGNQLKRLWLGRNNIEVIPTDLFEDTKNLEFVYLTSNPIKHVGRGALSNLQKLHTLFYQNNCYADYYINNRANVINMIAQVESKCIDEGALRRYKNQLLTTEKNLYYEITACKKLKDGQNLEIENLKAKLEVEKSKWQKFIEAKDALQLEVETGKVKFQQLKDEHKLEIDAKDVTIKELQLEIEAEKAQNFEKSSDKSILLKLNELEAKINSMKENDVSSSEKLSLVETKLATIDFTLKNSKDDIDEKFTAINATCTNLEYKIDILRIEPLRQP